MSTKNNNKRKKIIKVANWEEAEKYVVEKKREGWNVRDILKLKFLIGNEIIGLNPSRVSEIDKKYGLSSHVDFKQGGNYNQTEALKKIFKMLWKKTPYENILIEFGDPKLVNNAVEAYNKLAGYEPVPKKTMDALRAELSVAGNCSTYEGLLEAASKSGYSHYLRKTHMYKCAYCGEPEIMGKNEFSFMQSSLPKNNFAHLDCLKKNGESIGRFL